jgi:hypothetical protein
MVALGTNTKVVALVGETDTSWICQDLDLSGFGSLRIRISTYSWGNIHPGYVSLDTLGNTIPRLFDTTTHIVSAFYENVG